MDGILLKDLRVDGNLVTYTFEARGGIKEYFNTDTFFIEYNQDMTSVPKSILTIPFVSSLIPLMWLTNTVMWVEELDRTFYDCIFKVQAAYQRLYYYYDLKGNLVPANLVYNTIEPQR